MFKKFSLVMVLAILGMLTLSACNSADSTESTQVNKQQTQYLNDQPIPYFEWSLPRHLMVELYTAKNEAVATYSYVYNPYLGKIAWTCNSIGYPIPGGTQLTNPEQYYASGAVIPQAEPDGLFSPSTALGTYVFCVNDDGSVSPQYIEDNVHTYTYPMHIVDGELVRNEGSTSTIKIDPNAGAKVKATPTLVP